MDGYVYVYDDGINFFQQTLSIDESTELNRPDCLPLNGYKYIQTSQTLPTPN